MTDQEWQEIQKALVTRGVFVGLDHVMQARKVTPQMAGKIRANIFDFFSHRVAEAKKEVLHIQGALARLEAACLEGKRPVPLNPGQIFSGPVSRFSDDINVLDGWVVSLFETDMTIIGNINPGKRQTKMPELSRAFDTMWQNRERELMVGVKTPGLFNEAFGQ
jgi:hypothetical protein